MDSKTLDRPQVEVKRTVEWKWPRHILVPIDFSPPSTALLKQALCFAGIFGASTSVMHVVEPSPHLTGSQQTHIIGETQARLTFFSNELAAGPQAIEKIIVHQGKPFHEICEAARSLKSDLIIINAHGQRTLKEFLLGSTAERVVRHAPCPVLVLRELEDAPGQASAPKWLKNGEPCAPRQILVPVDFSECSKMALDYAVPLAKKTAARLTLLYVVEPCPVPQEATMMDIEGSMRESAKAMLEEIRKGVCDGIACDILIQSGDPRALICEAGKVLKTDLIMLTTRGYTGFAHVLLGSTAEHVIRHATCPVLAVREKQLDFARA